MLCEMCGTDRGRTSRVEVEGVTMQVCSECAKFGTAKEVPKPLREYGSPQSSIRSGPGFDTPGMARDRPPQRPRKDALSRDEEELVRDYPKRIRQARESMGLSHEDLGRKINEKKSVIAKLEGGTFRPNEGLIGKLQRHLGIKLKAKVEDYEHKTKNIGGPMTLGDLIKYEKA